MSLNDKLYPLYILLSVIAGLVIGQAETIRIDFDSLILPLLIVMLYLTFLQIPLRDIQASLINVKFTLTSLVINFLWTPILAWGLAQLFLSSHPAVFLGFFMLLVTPCTDWYLIFTSIAKGNVALSTAILPVNLILQILLLPAYLFMIDGKIEVIEPASLINSIVFVLLLPFTLSLLTKMIIKKNKKIKENIMVKLYALPVLFLCLAIMAMFAAQGDSLVQNLNVIREIAIPFLLFFIFNFFVSQWAGKILRLPSEDSISLSLTTLARNSPLALAIAVTAFPSQTLTSLTLIVGSVLELPVLAILSQVLNFVQKGKTTNN